jgi:hypothetical protein
MITDVGRSRTRRGAGWLAATLCGVGLAACGGSGSVPSGYAKVTGVESAGLKVSFAVPKTLPGGYVSNPKAGFKTYRALSAKTREAVEVSWGPGSGASLSSLLSALISSGDAGKSTSEATSSPHIPGASQTTLANLVYPGTGGNLRVLDLVARTKSGSVVEAFIVGYTNNKGFNPMTVINSISIAQS